MLFANRETLVVYCNTRITVPTLDRLATPCPQAHFDDLQLTQRRLVRSHNATFKRDFVLYRDRVEAESLRAECPELRVAQATPHRGLVLSSSNECDDRAGCKAVGGGGERCCPEFTMV